MCVGIFIAASGVLIAVMRGLGVRNVEPRTKASSMTAENPED